MNYKLNKEFYESESLKKAVNAYKSIASISISEDQHFYYYKIESSIYDSDLVAKEFENYVLGLMNT